MLEGVVIRNKVKKKIKSCSYNSAGKYSPFPSDGKYRYDMTEKCGYELGVHHEMGTK